MQDSVLVAGAGPVGLALALALAQRDFEVALIDPSISDETAPDSRVFALTPASRDFLQKLGLELGDCSQPVLQMAIADCHGEGCDDEFDIRFGQREGGEGEALAFTVKYGDLRVILENCVNRQSGISLYANSHIETFESGDSGIRAALTGDVSFEGALCCAADGARSARRREAGIATVEHPYNRTGLGGVLTHEKPHEGVAYQYFFPAGPLALLPLPPDATALHRSGLVWVEKPDVAHALAQFDSHELGHEVQQRINDNLGEMQGEGPPGLWPLSFRLALEYVKPRLALVGDAAHGVHPLAGQGFNMGLKDVATLVNVLEDARRIGLDIGSLNVLEGYQRRRRFDNTALAMGLDGLHKVFGCPGSLPRFVRRLGLSVLDELTPLRQSLERVAEQSGRRIVQ